MISRTIFCSAQAAVMRRARTGPDAIDLAHPIGLGLDDVEHRLAEGLDHLPGVDRADAADHAGGEILLDALDGTRRRGAHETRLELLAMGAVVDPFARGGDPLAGGDRGRVADDGDEIAMAARLDAQHAKAVLGIMERDPLDGAGEHLAVGLGGGRRHGHGINYCPFARDVASGGLAPLAPGKPVDWSHRLPCWWQMGLFSVPHGWLAADCTWRYESASLGSRSLRRSSPNSQLPCKNSCGCGLVQCCASAVDFGENFRTFRPPDVGLRTGVALCQISLDDALGNPIGFFLTGGEAHDLEGADHLLPTMEADTLIADKAFDADVRVLEPLAAAGKTAVIPPQTNRSSPR